MDLATKLGWACGSVDSDSISHGVLTLPKTGTDIGRFLSAFREWLGGAIKELAPGEIIFEAPILPAAVSIASRRKLFGLSGVAAMVAGDYRLPINEASPHSVRKHFIGRGRAPHTLASSQIKRMWLKDTTIEECRSRGFCVAGDDDADALALLSYALNLKQPGFVLRQMPRAA